MSNSMIENSNLNSLLIEATEISTASEQAKAEAKAASVAACRAMESLLIKALAGGRLRGVKALKSSEYGTFLGYRVRGNDPTVELGMSRCGDAIKALCVNELGKLVIAWASYADDTACVQDAQDKDFNAEDAEDLAGTLAYALPIHVAKSKASHKRYSELKALNNRLLAAFSDTTDQEAKIG